MRFAWVGCLVFASLLVAGTEDADSNVNTRYKVETVIVSGNGWSTDFASSQDRKISSGLGKRISALIGDQLNPAALDDVARRLRKELQATVTRHVERGASPEYVKVVFQVDRRNERMDGSVTKLLYDAEQGWSGAAESSVKIRRNAFTFGLVSDGDDLAERYAGIAARYENARIGSDRVRFRFEFDSYRDQWNSATLEDLPSAGGAMNITSAAYRTRQNFEPAISFQPAEPITLTVGTSFERFQEAFPAARIEAANAVVAGLRYHRRMEGSAAEQDLDAGYNLRAGAKALGGDFAYARNKWEFRYLLTYGRHVFEDDASAGMVTGRAPLYERYVLGNSHTLRGWNKYEIDPIGGNRMVHNSVEYRYGVFEIFYDAGAIWDEGRAVTPRQGIGSGLRHGPFELAVAFPIRNGRADPVFMMGMNY
jgi:hypothetical protein